MILQTYNLSKTSIYIFSSFDVEVFEMYPHPRKLVCLSFVVEIPETDVYFWKESAKAWRGKATFYTKKIQIKHFNQPWFSVISL